MNAVGIGELSRWQPRSRIRRAQALAVLAIILVLVLVHRAQRRAAAESRATTSKQSEVQRARMSDEISVHAAGRGNPWINLSDGHQLITSYSGPAELTRVVEQNEARPLSLCSADFDEDGVPDLISGYAGPNGGIVTLLRGNVDSIYPNAPEAQQRKAEGTFTDAPFLSPAFVFGVPEAPDFIGAGDFDGDSHWDVVGAARGSNKLYLLSGDGKGGLRQTRSIDLPGGVTAMVVGEINRRDGLDDVVVGVSGEQGSKVLVYEGPEGALRAGAEAFDLSAEATSLALGQLDESYEMDLAIAAADELMIVHGRDRKLSMDTLRQAEVRPARIEKRLFPFSIRSIAAGDFNGSHNIDIALLADDGNLTVLTVAGTEAEKKKAGKSTSFGIDERRIQLVSSSDWSEQTRLVSAKVSSAPVDSIVVVDSAKRKIEIITGKVKAMTNGSSKGTANAEGVLSAEIEVESGAEAVLPMRLNSDASSDLVLLREGYSTPGVASTAAAMTFVVTNTNDSGAGSLRQAINSANANPGADMITFNVAGSGVKTFRPLSALPLITDAVTIDGYTQPGSKPNTLVSGDNATLVIEISGGSAPRHSNGLTINASRCTVRGIIVNGFSVGIRLDRNANGVGQNIIEGNLLGTDPTGIVAVGNGLGVLLKSPNTLLGGTLPQSRNIISGNGTGVSLSGEGGGQLQGNFIGTDITGTRSMGNSDIFIGDDFFVGNGVRAFDTSGALTVGGAVAGARNIISSNVGAGIELVDVHDGCLVQGNYIGTDVTGTVMLLRRSGVDSNTDGVFNVDSPNLTVGGTTLAARNVVSGNTFGIRIGGLQATGNLVQGNLIGTDVTGTAELGNSWYGVAVIGCKGNGIGGAIIAARNVISGNGLRIVPGFISIGGGVSLGDGVFVLPADLRGGEGAVVQNNYIGTDITGIAPLGNKQGIFVENESIDHQIKENSIAFNRESGVRIPNNPSDPTKPEKPAINIAIQNNGIFSNGALGIDLGTSGITPNDNRDPDTGANELQNFPMLDSATSFLSKLAAGGVVGDAVSTTIAGTFNSTPNSTFTLQFFFGSDCDGSGHQFTGAIPVPLEPTIQVTTDSIGNAPFNFTFEFPVPVSRGYVNSTATDATGNTSELSSCFAVINPNIEGPVITSAFREGKHLIVAGENFDSGAKIIVNGGQRKTVFETTRRLKGKKLYKQLTAGQTVTIQVRNPDGTTSNAVSYTKPTG